MNIDVLFLMTERNTNLLMAGIKTPRFMKVFYTLLLVGWWIESPSACPRIVSEQGCLVHLLLAHGKKGPSKCHCLQCIASCMWSRRSMALGFKSFWNSNSVLANILFGFQCLLPQNQLVPWKIAVGRWNFPLEWLLFRGHVSFRWCIYLFENIFESQEKSPSGNNT